MSARELEAQALRGQLQSLGRALELAPQDVTLMRRFADVLRQLGARREALALYARALELDPGSADRHCELAALHAELRHHEEAAAAYAAALRLRPDHVPARVGTAALLRLRGQPREAETLCRTALQLAADDSDAWTLLGELCADDGRFAQAEECFRRALQADPAACGALIGMATHRKLTSADAEWRRCVETLLTQRLPLRHAIGLRYALGKYCDDLGDYAAAFAHYAAANALAQRQLPPYDGAKLSRRVDALIAGFDADAIARARAHASPAEQPVFVVGMPRSGTSLLEQILASHPEVVGIGERPFWDAAFIRLQKCGPDREAAARLLPGIAVDYLALIGARGRSAPRGRQDAGEFPLRRPDPRRLPARTHHPSAAPSHRHLPVDLLSELRPGRRVRQRSRQPRALLPRVSTHHRSLARFAADDRIARAILRVPGRRHGGLHPPTARLFRSKLGPALPGFSRNRAHRHHGKQVASPPKNSWCVGRPLATLRIFRGTLARPLAIHRQRGVES